MKGAVTIRRAAGFAWQMPFSRGELVLALSAMRDACGIAGIPLDVTLADDAFLAGANAEYLRCPGPTNILAFPPSAPSGPGRGAPPGTGILLLSLDALQREARLYGRSAAEYAMRLFAHGMAHLAGLDHGTAMETVQNNAARAGIRALSV